MGGIGISEDEGGRYWAGGKEGARVTEPFKIPHLPSLHGHRFRSWSAANEFAEQR